MAAPPDSSRHESPTAPRGALPAVAAARDEAKLLRRFVETGDESAFMELVERLGPMVFGVCRRILRSHHDAEDAFQATFLIFARKAHGLARPRLLAPWLYKVAYRTAVKAKSAAVKRQMREKQMDALPPTAAAQHDLWPEVEPWLDQELSSLPEKYRIPIVICDLEGQTHAEAARRLAVPSGTLSTRLTKARSLLAKRLARRGIVLSAGTLALLLSQHAAGAAIPVSLAATTATAAGAIAGGQAVPAGLVSSKVVALAKGSMAASTLTTAGIASALVLSVAVAALGLQPDPKPTQEVAEPQAAAGDILGQLTALGAVLERDESQPYQPVVGIHFNPRNKFADRHLPLLKEFLQLKSLNLSGTAVSDAGLPDLTTLGSLTKLELAGKKISGKGLASLAPLTNLTFLSLYRARVDDNGLAALRPLKNLKTLDLRETQITDQGLKELKGLAELENLYLDSTAVSDIGLKQLAPLAKLKHLSLSVCGGITDLGMREIGQLPSLELLAVARTPVSNEGLKELQNLIHVNVSQTQVTDAGLAVLQDFRRLSQLRLGGPLITDAAVAELEKLPRLRELELDGTAITDAGLERLQDALTLQATISIPERKLVVQGRAPILAASTAPRPAAAGPAQLSAPKSRSLFGWWFVLGNIVLVGGVATYFVVRHFRG